MDLKVWAFRAAQAISAKWDVYDGFAEYSLFRAFNSAFECVSCIGLGRTKWTVPMFMQFV
jgi:hypothetical protein